MVTNIRENLAKEINLSNIDSIITNSGLIIAEKFAGLLNG